MKSLFKGAIEPPAPGIYPGVPAETYHKWNAVSSSVLKTLAGHEGCPLKCRDYLDRKDEIDSPALALGRAIHDAILLPEDYLRNFTFGKACEAVIASGKNKGKACGKPGKFLDFSKDTGAEYWVCGTHAGPDSTVADNMITDRDQETVENVRKAVHAHPEAQDILFGEGSNEASIVWVDSETGLTVKTRIDRYAWTHRLVPQPGGPGVRQRVPTHIDIKTTASACRWKFSKQIDDLGYHIQAAMHFEGCDTIAKSPQRRYLYIAVEKEAPYAMGFYELEPDAIEQGAREYRRLLTRFAHCLEKDEWPGYTADQIGYISIPSYAFDAEVN